jgi:hypothetical protein
MTSENPVSPNLTEEARLLIEMHRKLIAFNGFTLAQEQDTYSLAQPSPFRFVPTMASNGAATLLEGE